MKGKFFVTLLLFFLAACIGTLLLFNFYPPAGNSPWTLAGWLAIAVVAVFAARRAAR